MKIAVLLTCFNRKVKTLRCLTSLVESSVKAQTKIDFEIFVTDDGSIDGTSDSLKDLPFASKIHILQGDGSLFWNGGMNRSWDAASKYDKYDGYLWLNDDCLIYPEFWLDLDYTDTYCYNKYGKHGIYIGSTCDPQTKIFTYGGFKYVNKITLKDEFVMPDGISPQECECGHGNITYISREVEKRMGHLYHKYRHGGGDHDYTYRTHLAGFPVLVLPNFAGECENDHIFTIKEDFSKLGLRKRTEYLCSPFGFNLHNALVFQRRCFPFRYPFVLISGIMKAMFPMTYFKIYNFMRK